MIRFIQWLWGEPLGKVVKVKSWMPCLELFPERKEDTGIAWPVLLVDHRDGSRRTIVPIWNWVWLRNRIRRR